ncbi:hypothetical protein AB0M46_21985 [Dactylosporangium sp. NPDC051485]|uniref:hypothetical protein n=1 Tax=Dactylosporangium sp. NPDC051485 TaxID=3154846 RepID=UPI003412542D
MTRTYRGLALAIAVPLVLVAAAGCSGKGSEDASASDRPTVEVTAQPQDAQSAQVAAEQVLDNLSEGDWAGAYDMWTDGAKSAIGKDAYIELVSTCTGLQGDYQVTAVAQPDATTTTIKWTHVPAGTTASQAGQSTLKYEHGAWRLEPDQAALAAYKQNKCP